MKKRISLFLSALMALSLISFSMTGCLEEDSSDEDEDEDDSGVVDKVNGKTPEELYAEALSAMNTATNYETTAVQDIKMVMTYEGETQNVEQTQTIATKHTGEDIYVKIGGSAIAMETWYVDGMLYVISGETKAKAQISLEDYKEQYMSGSDETLLNVPSDWFEGIKFEKEDGKYHLNFHVSGEAYQQVVGNLLENMGLGDTEYTIGEVDYTVIFDKKGNIEKIISDFSASYSIDTVTVKADYHTVTTVKLSGVSPVTAPADGNSFIDVTDSMGGIG